jgi:hypothetical protein
MKIIKTNDERISLNLNSKHKTNELRQKHEICKIRIQKNIYCDEIKNYRQKKITSYGVKSYLKLVLTILKILGSYLYLYPFRNLA